MMCNCTGPGTQTCHPSNPYGHQVGCPEWGPRPGVWGVPLDDDTQPIQLVVCEHTDSPWCPACAGGVR